MNALYRKRGLLCALVVVALAVISYRFVSKEVRLDHLNRTLISAVKSGNVTVVRAVLAQGADPNSRENSDRTITQIISDCSARLLGKKFHADEKAPSALFLAVSAEEKNKAVIETLLKYGADPNARGDYFIAKDHVSTLMLYCALEGDQETIQALATAGADVNVTDEYGITTLSLICFYANAKTVQTLLDNGANPNIRGNRGETPLLAAVDAWNGKVVKLLIQHGAKRNIVTGWSMPDLVLQKSIDTLLMLATLKGRT